MKYDTTFINRNFLLKVYGVDSENRRINRLVGVSGLVGLIGVELTEKFITRALNSKKDSVKCCLRRGLQVTLSQRITSNTIFQIEDEKDSNS